MFEKNTPLGSRARNIVAGLILAPIVLAWLGWSVYLNSEISKKQDYIYKLENRVRKAEAAYAAEDRVTALVVRHACDPLYRAQLISVQEQRDSYLRQIRDTWNIDGPQPAPYKGAPACVQYDLAKQALHQCWGDLNVIYPEHPSKNVRLLDVEELSALARNDLQSCEESLFAMQEYGVEFFEDGNVADEYRDKCHYRVSEEDHGE